MDTRCFTFRRDTTTRMSFRKGDMLIHFRCPSIFGPTRTVVDLWSLDDGQYALLSNRAGDLPAWFKLHPSEVSGGLVFQMLEQFNQGDYPPEPLDGPNIWRIKAGDSVAWIGDSRPDMVSREGVLQIINFQACALILGEPISGGFEQFMSFGALLEPMDEAKGAAARTAMGIIIGQGIPRTYTEDWSIGS